MADIIDPQRPIVDPHHHLWDRRIFPLPAHDPMMETYDAVARAAHSFNRGMLSSDKDGRRGKDADRPE